MSRSKLGTGYFAKAFMDDYQRSRAERTQQQILDEVNKNLGKPPLSLAEIEQAVIDAANRKDAPQIVDKTGVPIPPAKEDEPWWFKDSPTYPTYPTYGTAKSLEWMTPPPLPDYVYKHKVYLMAQMQAAAEALKTQPITDLTPKPKTAHLEPIQIGGARKIVLE